MNLLAGTGRLVRFHLRRDWFSLLCWIVGGVLLYYSQAASVQQLYPSQAKLDTAARAMAANPAFVAMAGPARALNTVGGQVAWQAGAFGEILAGLMSMFLIGRHTRAEEESGRGELIRSYAGGRFAGVASAAVVVLIANVALGAAIAGSLAGFGLPGAGSLALGVAAALAGLVFGGVTLVAVQLTEGIRAAYGITGVALGAAYLLRAAGDVGNRTLSWLSPIGWGQQMRAFAGERWWPVSLSGAAVVVLAVAAAALFERRDAGAGVLPTRAGPASAGRQLSSGLGLAVRLQRGSLIGWALALLFAGLAYGSIGNDIGDLLGDSELSQDIFVQGGASMADSFYATSALMLALIASGFAVASALRARAEEAARRVEPLLATALSRWRWAAAQALVSAVGAVIVVLASGVGLALGYGLVTGEWAQTGRLLTAPLPYLAAVWCLVGFTWLAYGLAPRVATVGWLGLGFCAVVMLFAQLLRFPQWVREISPFTHLPMVPADSFALGPVLVVTAVAIALIAAGVVALRRRDIA